MKLTEMFLAELEAEAKTTRTTIARVPDGHDDWKPHEKSMTLGRLAHLVATMPGWIAMMIDLDEFDVYPPGAESAPPPPPRTTAELLEAFDEAVAKSKASLEATTDEHLLTNWTMKAQGHPVNEGPRYLHIRHGVLNHLAHHRGQLTVYLRLNDAPVPQIYGPTADEGWMG